MNFEVVALVIGSGVFILILVSFCVYFYQKRKGETKLNKVVLKKDEDSSQLDVIIDDFCDFEKKQTKYRKNSNKKMSILPSIKMNTKKLT